MYTYRDYYTTIVLYSKLFVEKYLSKFPQNNELCNSFKM